MMLTEIFSSSTYNDYLINLMLDKKFPESNKDVVTILLITMIEVSYVLQMI